MLVVVLFGAVSVVPATAGKKKPPRRVERKLDLPYSAPAAAIAFGGEIYGACHRAGVGCVEVAPLPGELFARVEILDASGGEVHALVERSGGNVEVCGETEETVFLGSDDPFLVWIFAGPCADGTPASATTGTVVATLSNQP